MKNAKWRQKSGPQRRDHHLKTAYGISETEYVALLAGQDGRCAICRTTEPGGRYGRFCVDHNHGSDRVRGLLCFRCNAAVGLLDDDAERAVQVAAYLKLSVPVFVEADD